MYKLVAVDLDGTLLNSRKEISGEDKKYISLAIDKGVRVAICSGRIYTGARVFAKELSATGPLIACNGAVIRDVLTDRIYHTNPLFKKDCLELVDLLRGENIYFHIYMGDILYTERLEHSSLYYWNRNALLNEEDRINIKVVKDIYDSVCENEDRPSKVVVISEEHCVLDKARKLVEEIRTVEVASSNYNNFEIMNHGVNKGKALEILAKKLGILRDEIIAIGDNENDYSMIRFAGLGVAMGNAKEDIKGVSNYITLTNDENGVSEVIKKFVL
ncbi:MAG: Cof-type HAD-IIB family hydrolase [Bacillota bacterium]